MASWRTDAHKIYYRVGEGHKEFVADQSEDEDYYILTIPVRDRAEFS